MIITDYVQTGNKDDFTIIDDIFNKLLLVAVDSNLISFWLIIRLLRIILSTYFKASLWSVLPPLLSSQYTTKNYIQLLSGFVPPVTELWPSQVAAIPLAVGENDGGIINLRTSGGKTRVAEIAIINTLSSNSMSKVLYLAPFRSLAFEVEQSLSKVFNPLGITVSQLYGGSTANLTDFELINESQVVIATPEKAKALIRCGSGLETKIKLIVVDEGHLLGAEERYIKNEMFLTHIKEFASRNQIRMLLLSAVLPNAKQMEKVQSGLFIALRQIYKCAEETGTDFSLLLEAIANDSISANIHGEFAKWLNTLFDFLDDELLAMHEDFNSDGTDLDWVEPVFRKSLALIQAEAEHKEDYINLLRARTKALLNRIPNRAARKKLIASGIPLTVSMAILDDIDKFKSLALSFILSTDAEDQIEQTNNIVREIEIWSNANAANLMEFVPSQTILDNFRHCWISGMPLSEIIKSEPNAAKISKDYYGYTLPWIIHAISQMFDSESEQIFIQAYSSIAMFVELGLPNVTSSNIYLAGVRSRGAALELSNFDVFQNKSISEVKRILSSFQLQDCEISETTKAWIKLLSDSANSQKPKEVSFPAFTWKRNGLPDKLYLRETNGDCFLISEDGYFYEKVESTSELPFLEIANIQGLYFKRDDDIWNLRSNNPKITVR